MRSLTVWTVCPDDEWCQGVYLGTLKVAALQASVKAADWKAAVTCGSIQVLPVSGRCVSVPFSL